MALTEMAFSPATGLLDTTTYPTEPADETAARTQIQGRLNEIRDWLNDTLIVELMKASYMYAADTGSTDDYAITLAPVPAAYTVGMPVIFKANTANTGAATLNVNTLGAKTIKKKGASGTLADLATGDIAAGNIVVAVYDGTYFVTDSGLGSHLAETVTKVVLVTEPYNQTTDTTINLGFRPKKVRIQATIRETLYSSDGMIDANGAYADFHYVNANNDDITAAGVYLCYNASNVLVGTATITDTGLTISWALTGTLTGASGNRRLIVSGDTH